jgi:hypothetical protein
VEKRSLRQTHTVETWRCWTVGLEYMKYVMEKWCAASYINQGRPRIILGLSESVQEAAFFKTDSQACD